MNYLSIDTSKSTSRYVFLNNGGEKLVKPFTLENHHQDFSKLLARIKGLFEIPKKAIPQQSHQKT